MCGVCVERVWGVWSLHVFSLVLLGLERTHEGPSAWLLQLPQLFRLKFLKMSCPPFKRPVQRDSEAVARATDPGSITQKCRYQFNGEMEDT